MPYKPQYLEAPVVQAKQGSDTYIVNSCFLGSVESCKAPFIILFFPAQMIPLICFRVISFLEDLICPDTGFTNCPESLNIEGCCIDVYPAYFTGSFFDTVNKFHRMGNIAGRILRMLAIDEDQTFLSVIFQCLNLPDQLTIIKCLADSI